MLPRVSRKPRQVCSVNMLPIASGGESSLTLAENCAESAITVTPHTRPTASTARGGTSTSHPMISAQVPLRDIAPIVVAVRPKRSAQRPPRTAPMAPTPMVAKVARLADDPGLCTPVVVKLVT